MFVADRFVYLELQKTAGSHLVRLLGAYTGGRSVGKHNRIPESVSDKQVIGSIRSPWDWYVSLWAYGASGRGAVRHRLCRNVDIGYYHRGLARNMGKSRLSISEWLCSLFHDLVKPVNDWQAVYADVDNPELFRRWLKRLLDYRRRYDIGEGFGFSPLSANFGLMTYRYLRLYAGKWGDQRLYRDTRLLTYAGIVEFDRENNFADFMIRSENLEPDFIAALEACGYDLSAEQKQAILASNEDKTNASSRQPLAYYYDQETIALVAERDKFLIEKYGYRPPLSDSSMSAGEYSQTARAV